jgi:hypothetical protein
MPHLAIELVDLLVEMNDELTLPVQHVSAAP